MKQLIIIGARGWGREVYASFKETEDVKSGKITIKGFLDSKADAFENLRGKYPPILCSPEDYEIQSDDIFFVAMGNPKWRKHYAEMFELKGAHFYTYISPDAFVNQTALIGEGSYVARWCAVSDNVKLGKHTLVHPYTCIGHDAEVHDYGTLLTGVFMGGGAIVGEESQMSPKSMIIPHKKIGRNVMVGAGSVVIRNVKDDTSVHGNPAKKIEM